MKIRYLSAAEQELEHAVNHYEAKEIGLGLRFYAEVKNTIDRIVSYPEAWHQVSENARRCRTKIFPYGIIYQLRTDEIFDCSYCGATSRTELLEDSYLVV